MAPRVFNSNSSSSSRVRPLGLFPRFFFLVSASPPALQQKAAFVPSCQASRNDDSIREGCVFVQQVVRLLPDACQKMAGGMDGSDGEAQNTVKTSESEDGHVSCSLTRKIPYFPFLTRFLIM